MIDHQFFEVRADLPRDLRDQLGPVVFHVGDREDGVHGGRGVGVEVGAHLVGRLAR